MPATQNPAALLCRVRGGNFPGGFGCRGLSPLSGKRAGAFPSAARDAGQDRQSGAIPRRVKRTSTHPRSALDL